MVACPTDGSFTIGMTSAFIVIMIVPFINPHTELTVQVFIYFIYVAGHNKIQLWKIQT